ncbi:hypothetical protein WJX79_010369 [Trebouxia sp. C0005]
MESDSGPNRKRKLAVQAILDRNAEVIHALHALQRSRTDLDPSAVELSLAQEVKDNMLSLALAHPPNAIAGPGKRAKTFVRTVRHMGLLPVKQKNKPSAERQLPPDLASVLTADRSASLGHQQLLSNAATRLAESDSKAASNPSFERQVPHTSLQAQQRPGITDVQKDNLQRTLRMISEIAPGKRPDDMLLRFVMSKAESLEAHSIRMIEGMPHWQRQMLRQAHAQQLALSQQSDGARGLAHMLQQVSANSVESQAQHHTQAGKSQQESVPEAQAKQCKAEQGPDSQVATMTGMRKGSSAESPRAVTQTRSPSLQRNGSLQREESAGRVLLDAGMPLEPVSVEHGQSQRLQTHRLQGQRQQPQSSQGQLHESRDQQSRPSSSQGAQQGHFQSQQPQPQRPQEELQSQQPILVNQAPQLSHLSRLASMSDDLPGQQDDAARSELHAIQQQLLAKSRSRSTEADKQAKAQMPEALAASRPRAGAKDLLSQMHQQQAASRPASPSRQDLADKADAMFFFKYVTIPRVGTFSVSIPCIVPTAASSISGSDAPPCCSPKADANPRARHSPRKDTGCTAYTWSWLMQVQDKRAWPNAQC